MSGLEPVMLCFATWCKMRGDGARLEEGVHSQIFCIVWESTPATSSSTHWGEKRKGDCCSGDNFLPVPNTGMKTYLWRKKTKKQSKGWWLPNCQSILPSGQETHRECLVSVSMATGGGTRIKTKHLLVMCWERQQPCMSDSSSSAASFRSSPTLCRRKQAQSTPQQQNRLAGA